MSRSQAFSLFRQCTASLSPHISSQRAAASSRLARLSPSVRLYSTPSDSTSTGGNAASAGESSTSGNDNSAKDAQASTSSEAELSVKLKAKEQEVVDLTVCMLEILIL